MATEAKCMPAVSSISAWVNRCIELGAIEGTVGSQGLESNVDDLVRAMHHVLAGGTVTVTVNTAGTTEVVDELNLLLDEGITEANRINDDSGTHVFPVA